MNAAGDYMLDQIISSSLFRIERAGDNHIIVWSSGAAEQLEAIAVAALNKTKTVREIEMEELLRSAHAIAARKGEGTAWERFAASIKKLGIGSVTARTYRVLGDDKESLP